MNFWLSLAVHYRAGHLYTAGGIADQPAIYLHVMRLIEGVWNEPKDSN